MWEKEFVCTYDLGDEVAQSISCSMSKKQFYLEHEDTLFARGYICLNKHKQNTCKVESDIK